MAAVLLLLFLCGSSETAVLLKLLQVLLVQRVRRGEFSRAGMFYMCSLRLC